MYESKTRLQNMQLFINAWTINYTITEISFTKSEWVNRIWHELWLRKLWSGNMAWFMIEKIVTYPSPPAVLVVCWSMPVSPEAHNLLPPLLQTETDEGGGWLPGSSFPWEGGKCCSHSQTPTEAAHSTYRPRQQYQLIYYRTWCSQMYIYSNSYCVNQRYNSKSKITSWYSYLVTLYIHILKSSIVIIS